MRHRSQVSRKHPINIDLLRSPGHSIKEKIDEISVDIDAYLAVLMMMPLLIYVMFIQSNLHAAISQFIYFLVTICTFGFVTFKLICLVKEKVKLSLGYDAELAVGQELNQLMRAGYWVFHDVQADNHNVDHVVVGKTGVFAVETKGRSKPINQEGKAEYSVTFDGEKLNFPGWAETAPIAQARRQSLTLQQSLSRAVGEEIIVKSVLAIPGWNAVIKSKSDIALINGKNCIKYFNSVRGDTLDDKLIERIAYQLEQRCRNVKAKTYAKSE
jgi:hypothetical protein